MKRRKSAVLSHSRHASQGRESVLIKDVQGLPLEMVCDPWPVTKLGCNKDSVLEAARALLRARNTELVSICSKIILLPASGNVHGVQGGSRERSLYSLHAPSIEPFKVHIWQIPAKYTWNRRMGSWVITPGKIMVRRGQKCEPLTQLLKTLGVAKGEAKTSDLCTHFRCWRSLDTGGEWLKEFPKHLRLSVYQRWWSFNGVHFLQLPPELREVILTFALGPRAVPFAKKRHLDLYPGPRSPDMRLSRVNKQVNREVIATLLAHTKFYFYTFEQFLEFFKDTQDLSRAFFRPIKGFRFLELDLSPYALLYLFGVTFSLRDNRYEQRLAPEPGIYFDDETPLCHKIRINIPTLFHHPRAVSAGSSCCQKNYNQAFWAGARAQLCKVAVVEFVGQIDIGQKEEWLAEHALERKGFIPRAMDFAVWQQDVLSQW